MPNTGMIKKVSNVNERYKQLDMGFSSSDAFKKNVQTDKTLREPIMYSRYTTVKSTSKRLEAQMNKHMLSCYQHGSNAMTTAIKSNSMIDGIETMQRNKLAPFSTLGKPTCGFNFSRDADNRKKKFGILPSNLVKWRSEKMEKINMT